MKTTIFILFVLLGNAFCCFSQNTELSEREKHCLDSIARATLKKFGDKQYSELCRNEKAVITMERIVYDKGYSVENDGRLYYKVLYPNPDSLKPVRLEYNYAAYIFIWEDSKEAYAIYFGNGYGFPIARIPKEEYNKNPSLYVMPFNTVDFGEIEKEAKANLELMYPTLKGKQEETQQEEPIEELPELYSKKYQDRKTDSGVIEVTEKMNGALTIKEAQIIYEKYMTKHAQNETDIYRDLPLNPGRIENDWEHAATSFSGANSYVSVPSHISKVQRAKSPHNAEWVRIVQKPVIVQEDKTRRHDVYLLSIIPEGKYTKTCPEVIAEVCKGGNMPDDFSGLIVYTRLEGGMVLYAGWYQEGLLKNDVFVFDKNYSFEENLNRLNEILKGYHTEEVKV